MNGEPNAAIHGPYEDLGIAICELIKTIVTRIPETANQEIWNNIMEDCRRWREFMQAITGKETKK